VIQLSKEKIRTELEQQFASKIDMLESKITALGAKQNSVPQAYQLGLGDVMVSSTP
jgi:hypothetical protein